MKTRFCGFFLLLTLIGSTLLGVSFVDVNAQGMPDVFVGVDIAYGGIDDVKQLADEVSLYTNLFILGGTAVTQNRLLLEEACQYLFDKGLFFIVYQEYPLDFSFFSLDKSTWLETAKTRWGNHFLGIYYIDEVGGRQLDQHSHWISVSKADSYAAAGKLFDDSISRSINWFRNGYSSGEDVSLFMSDYAFYWFDYQAGYDVLLAQFGWNYSRQLNVGLCRGAASAQDKEWGVMITWTYMQPPYVESGLELYDDLVLAYDNDAKYIVVFNSNEDYTGSILGQEHLYALKQFWQYTQQNSRKASSVNDRTAYVLPKDYAYGFRGPEDKIWGLWAADALSGPISSELGGMLLEYDSKLDIIYEDELGLGGTKEYKSFVYWNKTPYFSSYPSIPSLEPPITWSWSFNLSNVFFVVGVTLALTTVGCFVFFRRARSKAAK